MVQHVKLKDKRIIKQIHKSSPNYSFLSREAHILKSLNHPSIPQIFDAEEDDEALFIVEEYIEGESLSSICQNKKLQEKTIIALAIQFCDLIFYLHSEEEPLLYLDIKPQNLLLNGEKLYLVDFGSVRTNGDKEPVLLGTPWFAAPEQYTTYKVDEGADIYGIGMLLYYMVLGKDYVREKGNHIDLTLSCNTELKRIINRCLKWHSFQRYHSVSELKDELSRIENRHRKVKNKHITHIAVAGTKRGVGATYLSLQFAAFLNQFRHPCLYIESNEFPVLGAFVREDATCYSKTGYRVQNIPCEHKNQNELRIQTQHEEKSDKKEDEPYEFVITDLGMLTEENLKEFTKADLRLLVMGSKTWEMDSSVEAVKLCGEDKQTRCLINFASARDYYIIAKMLHGYRCYRIPIEPQMYQFQRNGVPYQFYRDLLKEIT